MNTFPWISLVTFSPLAGVFALWLLPSTSAKLARKVALASTLLTLLMIGFVWRGFDPASGTMQFVEVREWMPSLSANYHVGVDGLGLLMVLLTGMVVPMSVLAACKVEENKASYYSLILLLQTGLFGTFTALNFLHWFIYWESCLIPAFFLIKLWGGSERNKASAQFFIYTMVGSVAMLLSFLAIYQVTRTFDFLRLSEMARNGEIARLLNANLTGWPQFTREELPLLIFSGAFLGFAVKVPLIPFHTWLPATYAEAPSSTTMMLTGLMSKMGVYGFLRILLPIFPDQIRMILTPLLWLAVATIVLSACAAFAQKDLKRLFAYSSINHLGYCLLGIFAVARFTGDEPSMNNEKAAALNGVMLQMFNHGITASLLFCFVAFLESRSNGVRGLDSFGGLRKVAPVFCGLMGISVFASLGLPGLNGFIGEFLIFKGAFPLATWATALSVIGILVTAIFLLTFLQRVFNGPLNPRWSGLTDLTWKERLIVLPATGLMLFIGLNPQCLIGKINATVIYMVDQLKF